MAEKQIPPKKEFDPISIDPNEMKKFDSVIEQMKNVNKLTPQQTEALDKIVKKEWGNFVTSFEKIRKMPNITSAIPPETVEKIIELLRDYVQKNPDSGMNRVSMERLKLDIEVKFNKEPSTELLKRAIKANEEEFIENQAKGEELIKKLKIPKKIE